MLWHITSLVLRDHVNVSVAAQVIVVLRKTIFARPQALFEYLPPTADEWEIPRSRLTVKEAIGEGQYGKVFIGVVTGMCQDRVARKC